MAYAEDLKSSGPNGPCGFESRPRHLKIKRLLATRPSKLNRSTQLTAKFDSHGLAHSVASRWHFSLLVQIFEQRPGMFQVGRVEAFGEPVVDFG